MLNYPGIDFEGRKNVFLYSIVLLGTSLGMRNSRRDSMPRDVRTMYEILFVLVWIGLGWSLWGK